MTTKQEEVFGQIKELLMEHFDGGTLMLFNQDINDEGETETMNHWWGGLPLCLGLVELQKKRLIQLHFETNDDEE